MAIAYPNRPRLRHVHSSSRYDRTPQTLLAATKWYIQFRDVITFTEVGRDSRVAVLRNIPGFGFVHVNGDNGRDECALIYRKVRWKLITKQALQLSPKPMPTRSGDFQYALCVVLEHWRTKQRVWIAVVHLPAHVEGKTGVASDIAGQAAVYRESLLTLKDMAWDRQRQGKLVLITGDWNLSWRRKWVREYLRSKLIGLSFTFGGSRMPDEGTHGSRVIDYSATNLLVLRSKVMRDDNSSDHVPFAETLLLPAK